MIAQVLAEHVVCPQCRGNVVLSAAGDQVICQAEQLAYPIHDGIPVMLVEEAQAIVPVVTEEK